MKKRSIIITILLFVLLVISFFFDNKIRYLVGPLGINYFIEFLFSSEVLIILLLVVTTYFFIENKKAILPMWDGLAGAGILTFILKLIFERPRPFFEKFTLFGLPDYAFPSLHATVVFAVLPILFLKTKKIRWYWLVYAILVAVSRLILKQHYLSDVVMGMLVGLGSGVFVIWFYKKYNKWMKKHFKIFKNYFD